MVDVRDRNFDKNKISILVFYQFRKDEKTSTLWMVFVGYSFGVHKLYAQIALLSSSNYQKDRSN